VVKLKIPYHVLLGHPALSKFMAVLHYAYLKMKLSGPRGIITISGCYKHSLECAKASSKLAEALVSVEEKRQILQYVAMTQKDMPTAHQPAGDITLQLANDTKKISLDEAEPAKVVTIDAGLNNK
jgi:hypothetical protein